MIVDDLIVASTSIVLNARDHQEGHYRSQKKRAGRRKIGCRPCSMHLNSRAQTASIRRRSVVRADSFGQAVLAEHRLEDRLSAHRLCRPQRPAAQEHPTERIGNRERIAAQEVACFEVCARLEIYADLFAASGNYPWSGFKADWTTYDDAVSATTYQGTCNGWTSTSRGYGSFAFATLMPGASEQCGASSFLLCVEQ